MYSISKLLPSSIIRVFGYIKLFPLILIVLSIKTGKAQESLICVDQVKIKEDSAYLNELCSEAVYQKSDQLFRKLLELNIIIPEDFRDRALYIAYLNNTQNGNFEFFCRQYPISIHTRKIYSHLIKEIVNNSDLETINFLCSIGYPIHNRNAIKQKENTHIDSTLYRLLPSPLDFISDKNAEVLLDPILNLGENINGLYPFFNSPLYLAFRSNNLKYALLLLKKGAETEIEDCCNGTSLRQMYESKIEELDTLRGALDKHFKKAQ